MWGSHTNWISSVVTSFFCPNSHSFSPRRSQGGHLHNAFLASLWNVVDGYCCTSSGHYIVHVKIIKMILVFHRSLEFWSFKKYSVISCFWKSFFLIETNSSSWFKKKIVMSLKNILLHYTHQNTKIQALQESMTSCLTGELVFNIACIRIVENPTLMFLPVARWGFRLSRYKSTSFKMKVTFV